jgi:hypothetical protein
LDTATGFGQREVMSRFVVVEAHNMVASIVHGSIVVLRRGENHV